MSTTAPGPPRSSLSPMSGIPSGSSLSPMAGTSWICPPRQAFSETALLQRLLGAAHHPGALGWILPLAVAILAGLLRFVRLGEPDSLVFDETYYVKEAYSLLQSGYERDWPENANDHFNAGTPGVLLDSPAYVVHPPAGKWLIAAGMALFGADNAFGWRFSAALVGTLTVLLLALAAQRLFSSAALGAVAGLLLAVDGHHLVHSRTSLLDVFLAFWILAAFTALLLDRDQARRRLAAGLAARAGHSGPGSPALIYGPWLGVRPWRIAAGITLGLAAGTKWSALAFIAVFGTLTVLWDLSARRRAGIRHWFIGAVVRDGIPGFLELIPAAALTYLATWTGWFRSTDAYNRQWAASNPSAAWDWVPDPLRSLAEYHRSAFTFHEGLASEHAYEATPWSWLIQGRPTSFFYESLDGGDSRCAVEHCSQAVSSVGNPLIWWPAALALLVVLFCWAGRRDWRAGAVLAGIAAGYLPWFFYPDRTTFSFYAVAFEPFLILGLVYALGLLPGGPGAPLWRRRRAAVILGGYLAAVLLASAFFLPVWTAEVVPYEQWQWRMWMPSWI